MVAQLVCGLPKHEDKQRMGVEWCKSVRQRVERQLGPEPDDLLSFALESMLCLRPDARKSATNCHMEALLLLGRTQESHNEETNGGVSGDHFPDRFESGEASTIRLGGTRKIHSERMYAVYTSIMLMFSCYISVNGTCYTLNPEGV